MHINQLETAIKTLLFTLYISCSLSLYANNHNLTNSHFNHLSEINKEWLNHKEACPKSTISFNSDIDRIQLHLNLVIKHLKFNKPSNLNSTQLSNRMYLLVELKKYADKKIFPINKYHSTRQPYFVDYLGTNCAVGQMIYRSGHEQLVIKISKTHNYDYIEDIKTKGIKKWANEFGFTLEELKWIQPTYAPSTIIEQVLDGTNGSVTKIVNNSFDGSLTIAGDFTELNNLPCLNIGIYKNDQLSCLDTGVDGIINDILNQSGDIYVFGELNHNGQVFPVAKYDGSSWSYLSIPNRDSAICTSANFGGFGYRFEMTISHSSIPQHQEIWHYLTTNTWEKQAKVKGIILDIIASTYGRVHVGHFDSVIVYNPNSVIDTTLIVNNVLINSNNTNSWYGIGSNISDTVNSVIEVGSALIIGGTCSNQPGTSNVCLSRYFNSVLQPLFLNNLGTEDYSVNTIAYSNGSELTFGGNFQINPGFGPYGSNLATYNIANNQVQPIALLDQAVNSLSYFNNELYIGGDFQTNLAIQNINYLARIVSTVGIDKLPYDNLFNLYPNPFTTLINLEGIEDGVTFSILNIDGRIIKNGTIMNNKINDLDLLSKGTYLLHLKTTNGLLVKKIFK